MTHEFSATYQGDAVAILKTAQQLMASRGFEVSKVGGGEVRGSRNHSLFGGKTSDMLALVSELVIRVGSRRVTAEAEFGTLRKLAVFMTILIAGLEGLFIVLGLVLLENPTFVWISLAALGPWVVIGPAMLWNFRRLAFREVETFLKNLTTITNGS